MFDEFSTTDLIAIIAVLMAAGSLALEIRRWYESGVKLKLRCMVDVPFIVEGENVRGSDKPHTYVEASNRGDTPTTLTDLTFVYHPTILDELVWNLSMSFIRRIVPCSRFWKYLESRRRSEHHVYPFNPSFLDTGRRWHTTIFQEGEFDNYLNKGRFWLLIHTSHTDKLIKRRLIRHKNRKDITITIPREVRLRHKPFRVFKTKISKGDTDKADGD